MLRLGYNTNGFAHHRLEDAVAILAEIGYTSIALTVERDLLDPPDRSGVAAARDRLLSVLDRYPVAVTVETGSRFILDPRRKHRPTLLCDDESRRAQRIEFLKACIDLAAAVNAESVSLWSGASQPGPEDNEKVDERLIVGLRELLDHARPVGVKLGFEPEPDMLIDTMDRFERLHTVLNDSELGLTLDVGHIHCLNDGEAKDHIHRWKEKLWNVHLEDMRRGVHEHLFFGEGEMDFCPILDALREIQYAGPLHLELSRHSHNAVETASRSFVFLKNLMERGAPGT